LLPDEFIHPKRSLSSNSRVNIASDDSRAEELPHLKSGRMVQRDVFHKTPPAIPSLHNPLKSFEGYSSVRNYAIKTRYQGLYLGKRVRSYKRGRKNFY
jgi:hypothetical protein